MDGSENHQKVDAVQERVQEQVPDALWNYQHLLIAFVFTLVMQMITLPCLCAEGVAKVQFGMMFDGFVLARILVAYVRKERGRMWVFYAALLYTSPFWIPLLILCLPHE